MIARRSRFALQHRRIYWQRLQTQVRVVLFGTKVLPDPYGVVERGSYVYGR